MHRFEGLVAPGRECKGAGTINMPEDSGCLHVLATELLLQGHVLLLSVDMIGSHFPLVLFIFICIYLGLGVGPYSDDSLDSVLSLRHVDRKGQTISSDVVEALSPAGPSHAPSPSCLNFEDPGGSLVFPRDPQRPVGSL